MHVQKKHLSAGDALFQRETPHYQGLRTKHSLAGRVQKWGTERKIGMENPLSSWAALQGIWNGARRRDRAKSARNVARAVVLSA